MPESYKYYAFISYSSADKPWADWLKRQLERYRVPKRIEGLPEEDRPRHFRPIFQDRGEMRSSWSLQEVLQEALRDSRYLIVICSPKAATSEWVNEEVRFFRSLGRAERILPLIVDGSPNPNGVSQSYCFPPELRDLRSAQDAALGVVLPEAKRDSVAAADARDQRDGREGALLRIIAGLLAVNIEAVVQREKRRRLVRRLWTAAALILAVVLGAWAWDYNRVKTVYYSGWQSFWNIPRGILPLSPEARAHRNSYRFTYQRGKLRKIEGVDGTGYSEFTWVRNDLQANQEEFVYHDDGRLAEQRYRNHFGKLVQTEKYTDDLLHSNLVREEDLPAVVDAKLSTESILNGVAKLDADINPVRGDTRVSRYDMEYDRDGRLIVSRYQKPDGKPTALRDGTYGARYEYDGNGDVVKSTSLGLDGGSTVDNHGVASTLSKYDARHNLVEKTFVGLDGQPVIGEEGYARCVYGYDSWGRNDLAAYFDPAGRPMVLPAGVSSFLEVYDDAGKVAEFRYLDAAGKPVVTTEGHAIRHMEHNVRGHITRLSYFDPAGAPILNADGYAVVITERDVNGNPVRTRYLGAKGEPVANDGAYEIVRRFDGHGNTLFEQYLDAQGEPAGGKSGYATVEWRYDERDRVTEQRWLDAAGKLTAPTDENGVALRRTHYNDEDHSMAEQDFDASDQPTLGFSGAFDARLKMSRFGLPEEAACFDRHGEPALNKLGFWKMTQQFDEAGHIVDIAYFGKRGEPVIQLQDKTHRTRATFDQAGQLASVCCLDTADAPAPDKSGHAETRYRYDARGWMIAEDYFDGLGHPANNLSGVAGYRYEFDGRHNIVSMTSVDGAGQPMSGKEGRTRIESAYNERNQITRMRFFDAAGQPTISSSGFHRVDTQYDPAGRTEERTFYGVDDRRCFASQDLAEAFGEEKNKLGNAVAFLSSIRNEYDRFGRTVSTRSFGTNDEPVPGFGGAHRIRNDYNEKGLVSRTNFLDDRGMLTLSLVGYAACETIYDEKGSAAEVRYFGADGERMIAIDAQSGVACASIRIANDDHGRPVRFTLLDEQGKPFQSNVHASEIRKKYDARGNETEIAFFGLDGRPVDSSLGYSIQKSEYDGLGNVVRASIYDAQGRLIAMAPKHSITTYKNNAAGQTTEMQCLDEHGEPGEDENHVSRMEADYDPAGREVGRRYFDVAGRLVAGEGGYAASRARYDAAGQLVSQQYFSAREELLNVPQLGYAQQEYTYDPSHRMTETRCLDTAGKLVNSASGVARTVENFTATGSEAACFDATGKPVNGEQGWARRVRYNSVNGQPDRELTFDADGRAMLGGMVIKECLPFGSAQALGLRPGDIVLRIGPWSVLDEGVYSFAWRLLRFAISRVSSKEPQPALVYRDGELLRVTVPPGLLGANMQDQCLPKDQVATLLTEVSISKPQSSQPATAAKLRRSSRK